MERPPQGMEGAVRLGTWEIAGLAIALGADCFSVSVGLGLDAPRSRRAVAMVSLFGVIQGALFIMGYLVAAAIHWALHYEELMEGLRADSIRLEAIHDEVHWLLAFIGGCVLLLVGVNLIASSFKVNESRTVWHGMGGLVTIAFVVNADAFSAGLGTGMFDGVRLTQVAAIMTAAGSTLSVLGLLMGQRLGRGVGRIAQPIGGVILVMIALHGLIEGL